MILISLTKLRCLFIQSVRQGKCFFQMVMRSVRKLNLEKRVWKTHFYLDHRFYLKMIRFYLQNQTGPAYYESVFLLVAVDSTVHFNIFFFFCFRFFFSFVSLQTWAFLSVMRPLSMSYSFDSSGKDSRCVPIITFVFIPACFFRISFSHVSI